MLGGSHISLHVASTDICPGSYHFRCFRNKRKGGERTGHKSLEWCGGAGEPELGALHLLLATSITQILGAADCLSLVPGLSVGPRGLFYMGGNLYWVPGNPRILCCPQYLQPRKCTPQEMQRPHVRDASCRSSLTRQTEVAVPDGRVLGSELGKPPLPHTWGQVSCVGETETWGPVRTTLEVGFWGRKCCLEAQGKEMELK